MNEDDNKVVTMKVRVTPEFREKLVTTAKGNNRSMNAEIVDRLEKSFELKQSHETEMHLMTKVVQDQQKQIDQLQLMLKQLFARLERDTSDLK